MKPGDSFAHYEIKAPIGAGGMGEVFLAHDTKLRRDVAVKILPPGFAADRERIARFEREARTLASLQHANVASIYGFEEVDGRQTPRGPGRALHQRARTQLRHLGRRQQIPGHPG